MSLNNICTQGVNEFRKSVDILRECRRTLMHSYAFAFYLKNDINSTLIFLDNQKGLEYAVESRFFK